MDSLLIPISDEQRKMFFQWRDSFIDITWERNIKSAIRFDKLVIIEFPVLKGTPFADDLFTILPTWVEYLYNYLGDRNNFDKNVNF